MRAVEARLRVWREADEGITAEWAPTELLFELRAPCDGQVVEAEYGPGAWIDPEDELLHVVDTSRLRYSIRMHVDELARLDAPTAWIEVPGAGTLELPGADGRLLLSRPPVDPGSHVGALVYEGPAAAGLLPGAVLHAQVGVGAVQEAIAVPNSALVDEDGQLVVFVQVGGESFARRPVRLGMRGLEIAEVLDGVEVGERVVVDGAYTVRLASLSGAIPEHTH